ncbi:hypothetical protein SAMN05216368_105113 [Cryobacterium flavum]|uniref:Uncharacterized protein n=2 Tax=Cryobacterium TaxID=69578 RepID=A0A4R8V5B0_9MICO|nr:hypothetical protein [Cryobacterium flavum]TFB77124.1 hypothetical protein E3O21_09515 [Cryobacterium flavum]SDN38836.1 hypothetical protein SAMN05216368_105113 [Cryobacterium flavum]
MTIVIDRPMPFRLASGPPTPTPLEPPPLPGVSSGSLRCRDGDLGRVRSRGLVKPSERPASAMIARQLVLAVAALLAAALVPADSRWTDATFTDSEFVASAVTAIVVPAPVIDTCTAASVLV